MECNAGPFGPHLAKISTLHPFPRGAGSCTRPGRALSPSQETDELSRAQASPSPGAWGAHDGARRGMEGQTASGGAEEAGRERLGMFLGDGEGKDDEGTAAHGGGAEKGGDTALIACRGAGSSGIWG